MRNEHKAEGLMRFVVRHPLVLILTELNLSLNPALGEVKFRLSGLHLTPPNTDRRP